MFDPTNSLPTDSSLPEPIRLEIQQLQQQGAALLLYRSILETPIVQAFWRLLQTLNSSPQDALAGLQAYGDWFYQLAAASLSWQAALRLQILRADNPLTQQLQQKLPQCPIDCLSPTLVSAAQHDLRILQQLDRCQGSQIAAWMQQVTGRAMPIWEWEESSDRSSDRSSDGLSLMQHPIWQQLEQASDWGELLPQLADFYRQVGMGWFASYRAFRWQMGDLREIAYPDPIQLNELVGYEAQKATLQQNTEALLDGYPALHVLLYGSRGAGKSSLVKALLSAYGARGLRLIEVNKAQLGDLPIIVDRLRSAPQKFIIFVDDLSFEADDDAYKALKVVLEGSATARPQNVVVYATSNRRHLIREFFADRPRPKDADEIHHWDTVQEKLSFSDRFGLTLTFEPADQKTYLEIVQHLAQQFNLPIEPQTLEFRALQWATRHNGRSGRTARQFIDFLRAELRA
ncbi:MAG: ATP-binding protein [Elainella sp. Prado103]|jgi:hypothetical protein|nr:ATP-binding protein [Elainella sp. Prado103]